MAGIFSWVCYTVTKKTDRNKEAHFVYTWMSKKQDGNKERRSLYGKKKIGRIEPVG